MRWQENFQNFVLAGGNGITGGGSSGSSPAVLDNPQPGSLQSGIGLLYGWVCDATLIEIEINGGIPLEAAYGIRRGDTQEECGDTDNGFVLPFNWNIPGDGPHTVRALADGEEFAEVTVSVTTLGLGEYPRGLSGEYILRNFPHAGTNVTIRWQESRQNFVIVEVEHTAAHVSTVENNVILELGVTDLTPGNLFDLEDKTVRFTPDGAAYRIQVLPLQWVADVGSVIDGFRSTQVGFRNFRFPFSGTMWETVFVDIDGVLTFGADREAFYDRDKDRFLRLRDFGGGMVNTVPIISPLFTGRFGRGGFDPDNVNRRFVRRLSDRVVITWVVSEVYEDTYSFTLDPLLNSFQVVLHSDGTIDFSYEEIQVEDGIVGVFPLSTRVTRTLGTLSDPEEPLLPGHIDTTRVTVSLVGNHSLRFAFHMRGAILDEPQTDDLVYRVHVDLDEPFVRDVDFDEADLGWFIQWDSQQLKYRTYGPGVSPDVEIDGKSIAFTVSLDALAEVNRFAFFVDVVDFDDPAFPFDQTSATEITLPPLPSLRLDFSTASVSHAARDIMFEAFSYPQVPDETDMSCDVIESLGDRFDFLVFYTDFRLDVPEAGATSSGAIGESVSGVIEAHRQPDDYCSPGQLQVTQNVSYIGSPISAPRGTDSDGSFDNYNRQVWLLSHEIGHRWLTTQRAIVDGKTLLIGDSAPHWREAGRHTSGLHAPVAFPIEEEVESSVMDGNFWRDNGDRTFTDLSQPFRQAAGYSYLDLYLMGFLPRDSVPDFFLVENASFVRYDSDGKPVYTGRRIDISVEDEIAAHGPRLPPFEESQKDFSIGFVGIVQHGSEPSPMLLERITGIRQAFLDFWPVATGGVSTLTAVAAEKRVQQAQTAFILSEQSPPRKKAWRKRPWWERVREVDFHVE